MVLRRVEGGDEEREAAEPDKHYPPIFLRILTHNIRYAASTKERGPNEKPWSERLPLIMNQLFYHTRHLDGATASVSTRQKAPLLGEINLKASFICLQEVLHEQLDDILAALNHVNTDQRRLGQHLDEKAVWAHIGVGRDDGKTKGEYSPILYPLQLFHLEHFETTWLSPTTDKPSKGWDAGSIRILSSAVFRDKIHGKCFAVFNTHLDNKGSESRLKSVAIILDVIARIRSEHSWKTYTGREVELLDYFLAGDFNSRPYQEAYKALEASETVVDAHEAVPLDERYGSEDTFTGFTPKPLGEDRRVDVVWFGPKSRVQKASSDKSSSRNGGWKIEGYSVLPNVFQDEVYCSDHRCVVADTLLR